MPNATNLYHKSWIIRKCHELSNCRVITHLLENVFVIYSVSYKFIHQTYLIFTDFKCRNINIC